MDAELAYSDLIRVGISILCGSMLGFEREYQNKSAGFRTIILICLGSTIFTLVSQRMGEGSDDRVAANIITGIGFIGAGVIFKGSVSVTGLTTAAVIWIAAAVGMVVGIEKHYLGFALTVIVVIILSIFHYVENLVDVFHHRVTFTITFINTDLENLHRLEQLITGLNLRSKRNQVSKVNSRLVVKMEVLGNKKRIKQLNEQMINFDNIFEL